MTDFSSNHSRRISLFTSSLASKVVQFIRLHDTMEYVRLNVHMSLLMVQNIQTYDFEAVQYLRDGVSLD